MGSAHKTKLQVLRMKIIGMVLIGVIAKDTQNFI
jgi:hypothetical protein